MNHIKLWWNIIRPKTLFASACPVVAGVLLSCNLFTQYCTISITCCITLLCALGLQILSNLINDYYDYKKGSDRKGRIGFKRALAEGEVSIEQMKKAVYITLIIVAISGLFLVIKGGLPVLFIGVSAVLFAWLYTATRFSLSYLGIADIFCFLYYGIFAVFGTVYLCGTGNTICNTENTLHSLQTTLHASSVWLTGAVCGLISMTVLMINNLRDIEDDKLVQKKTLPVRFGKTTCEYIVLLYAIAMLVCTFVAFGLSLTNIIFIPAFMLYQEICAAKGKQYNTCLFKAGLLNIFFVILLALEVFI
ncbi:MAG: 1,4-dihydroxy-2-naphthoate octaprenyltransferase [Bacteroidales bacterium]|nr:1,4-dihydroxy-2-naphthoate octaprenyltransferase [Bacteroidales bacterium]